MTIAYSGDSITFPDNSVQNTAATGFGFKNRIINGAMVIDQRNAGASVSYSTSSASYLTDRWYGQGVASAGVFTLQQSTDAPDGFSKSVKATVTTASTPSGTNAYRFVQRIEGYNLADLNLGTVNAKAMTLSFWVKSSLTGTFGGSLWGGGATAWFPFSYTINAANTWEYKTVSIGAATTTPSTAFDTTNGTGLQLTLNLGGSSSVLTTPGSWIYGSTEYYGPTGQTNLIATNGATFYITGVQLEKGSTATSFDYRPYGTELALCQRYYEQMTADSTLAIGGYGRFATATSAGSGVAYGTINFGITKRAAPTLVYSGTYRWQSTAGPDSANTTSLTLSEGRTYSATVYMNAGSGGTAGYGGAYQFMTTTSYIGFSAEL